MAGDVHTQLDRKGNVPMSLSGSGPGLQCQIQILLQELRGPQLDQVTVHLNLALWARDWESLFVESLQVESTAPSSGSVLRTVL